jgi:HEAT repeat protein
MHRTAILVIFLLPVAAKLSAQGSQQTVDTTFDGIPLSAWIADLRAQAPYTRNKAAYAISSMGPAAKAAVPALIEALADDAPTVRFPVEVALREIGPAAKDAVPALTKALDDPNDDVAAMARKALISIQGSAPADRP